MLVNDLRLEIKNSSVDPWLIEKPFLHRCNIPGINATDCEESILNLTTPVDSEGESIDPCVR